MASMIRRVWVFGRRYASYKRSNAYAKSGQVEKHESGGKIHISRSPGAENVTSWTQKQVKRLENKAKNDQAKLNIRKLLLESYMQQRAAVTEHFASQEAMDKLLDMEPANLEGTLLEEMKVVLESVEKQDPTYTSKVSDTISFLCASFVNTFLVELNCTYALNKSLPGNIEPTSFLLRQDLLNCIKDEPKKLEIVKALASAYQGNDKNPAFLLFVAQLDKEALADIVSSMATSDSFNSLEHYRYNFLHFKSGQSVNYDHSDTLKAVQSLAKARFTTTKQDNEHYINSLDPVFETYASSAQSETDRLQLLVSITKILLVTTGPTPTYHLFGYLIEKLGNASLLNYQALVFNCIPDYEYKRTVLGSSPDSYIAPKAALHFKAAIEDDARILGPLMLYLSKRPSSSSFENFLSYYRLSEVVNHERVLDNSNYSGIVSKSRFTRNRDINVPSVVFDTDLPIIAPVDVVYNAIHCCIELGHFQYIDPLLNKLIVHTVDLNGNVHVALSFGNQENFSKSEYSLLIAQNYTFAQMAHRLFTKDLLILLLRASRMSDDVGRMMWLTPHLDAYLMKHIDASQDHILNIIEYSTSKSTSTEFTTNFWENDAIALIDTKLITEIERTLTALSLDGKRLNYDKFLHFSQTANVNHQLYILHAP